MGYPIGIFPEGEQNWDGRTRDFVPATAKLVRFLKIPVIVPIFKGGFLTKPRWSWQSRRCRIEVHYKRIIDAEEIKTIKLSEIESRISRALNHDDYEWQKENMVPIRSNKRAEHLELVHYLCPSCKTVGTMKSRGNTLFCSCGYSVEIDRYGFFRYPGTGPEFDSPRDWVNWQNSFLLDRLSRALDAIESGEDEDPVLLRDSGITLMRGARAKQMLPVLSGEARLYKDRLEIGDEGKDVIRFPLKEMTAVNTFKQQKFEFRYEKAQHRLQPPDRSVSGYIWEVAYKGLRDLLMDRGMW
jgi:1-acyl-sn-glycerol-3-phosphate acyltransferase